MKAPSYTAIKPSPHHSRRTRPSAKNDWSWKGKCQTWCSIHSSCLESLSETKLRVFLSVELNLYHSNTVDFHHYPYFTQTQTFITIQGYFTIHHSHNINFHHYTRIFHHVSITHQTTSLFMDFSSHIAHTTHLHYIKGPAPTAQSTRYLHLQ